jgi:hypothetical protein
VRIESLNLKPKQRFLYLIDYGGAWQFEVEILEEESSEEALYHASSTQKGKLHNNTKTMKKNRRISSQR